MLFLENDKECLYQWDINQRVIVDDNEITEVEFSNGANGAGLVCAVYDENGKRYANIPNILLQDRWNIRAYGCCDVSVIDVLYIDVIKRVKPDDYVYEETEVKTYEALEARVKALEENGGNAGGGGESLDNVFEFYLTERKQLNGFRLETTFAEIDNAYKSGKEIKGYYVNEGNEYPKYNMEFIGVDYVNSSADDLTGTRYMFVLEGNIYRGQFDTGVFHIYENGIVPMLYRCLTNVKPNPYALIVNESGKEIARYTGEREIQIDLPEETKSLPWEAITGKPFGDAQMVLPLTSYAISDVGDSPISQLFMLEDGVDYIVSLNGTEYTTTAKAVDFNGTPVVAVGNMEALGESGNDMPFMIMSLNAYIPDSNMSGALIVFDETLYETNVYIGITSTAGESLYYTKEETDALIGDIGSLLDAINGEVI